MQAASHQKELVVGGFVLPFSPESAPFAATASGMVDRERDESEPLLVFNTPYEKHVPYAPYILPLVHKNRGCVLPH